MKFFFISLNIDNVYIITAILGFILSVLTSYNIISSEFHGGSRLYGIWYLFSFTTLAFSTNSVVALITPYLDTTFYLIILAIICGIVTILLRPNFYRLGSRVGFWLLICYAILYYFLFLNFVLVGWVIFIPLTFYL